MNPSIPSQNIDLLTSLLNTKIISIKRQIFRDDMCLQDFEQMADGSVEIEFSNGKIIHFFAITEYDSVGLSEDNAKLYGDSYLTINPGKNQFWKSRINQEVSHIYILESIHSSAHKPIEFGVEFKLINCMSFCIEYINDENVLDTIRVIKKNNQTLCSRREISYGCPGK